MSQPGGSGCAASSSALTYDANGSITSRTDFANRKTCYASDSTRNLEIARIEGYLGSDACPSNLTTATPTAGTAQRKVTTLWHPFWRLEVRRAEPKLITTWVYNGQPDPTNSGAIASCAPADAKVIDQPIAVVCKRVEQPTIDDSGVKAFDAANDGAARMWTYTYNQYGQVLTANGPRTDAPGGKDDATTYTYYADTVFDASGVGHTLGDLATETNALGHVINYGKYDKNGRRLEKTDADGVKTTQTWHVRGWLTSVTRSAGGLSQTTTYDYDKVGQLKKVTEPDGAWTRFAYDAAHRLTETLDSSGNGTYFQLDAAGNRVHEERIDQTGLIAHVIDREFDPLGRMSKEVLKPATLPALQVADTQMAWTTAPPANAVAPVSITLSVSVKPLRGIVLRGDPATPASPYGIVRFADGATTLADVPVGADGTAAFVWNLNSSGARVMSATFLGNKFSRSSSASSPVSAEFAQATITQWTPAPPADAVVTDSYPLVATVARTDGVALKQDSCAGCGSGGYGRVQFLAGATVLGEADVQANGLARAAFNWTAKPLGTHILTARYIGTDRNKPSDASTSVLANRLPTFVNGGSGGSPLLFGGPNSLYASVIGPAWRGIFCDGGSTCPTSGYGRVRISEGANLIGEVDLERSTFPTDTYAGGYIVWTPTRLGPHNFHFEYFGTARNAPSSADVSLEVIDRQATKTFWDPAFPATRMAVGELMEIPVRVTSLDGNPPKCDTTMDPSCSELGYVRLIDNESWVGRSAWRIQYNLQSAMYWGWVPKTVGNHAIYVDYEGTLVARPSRTPTVVVDVVGPQPTKVVWMQKPPDVGVLNTTYRMGVDVTRQDGSWVTCDATRPTLCEGHVFGDVRFFVNNVELCSSYFDHETTTCSWTPRLTGEYDLRVEYSGNAPNQPSSTSMTVSVR